MNDDDDGDDYIRHPVAAARRTNERVSEARAGRQPCRCRASEQQFAASDHHRRVTVAETSR